MSQETEKQPTASHNATRILYQVQVRSNVKGIVLNGEILTDKWQIAPLPEMSLIATDPTETTMEMIDGLFPYVLAMQFAYGVLATKHGYAMEVRLMPHKVKTTYAIFELEPLTPISREATL